jgi:hypothetical protein
MKLSRADYFHILGAILAVGAVTNPISSVIGLLIVCASIQADRYFHGNVHDSLAAEVKAVREELAKL